MILAFGASAVDFVYVLPAWPAPGGAFGRLPIHAHYVHAGGQAATTAAACAAFGLSAAFAGVTGDDEHGRMVRGTLAARGVDLSAATIAGPQAYSVILLAEGHAERVVLWSRGAIAPRPLQSTDFRLLHVDDVYLDEAIDAARTARGAGRLVTTDVDQVAERTRDLIAAATHPILAEHVPGALTGEPDLETAMRRLRDITPAPIVVTRGAAGAVALDGDRLIDSPGFPVNAVDTTGAGDVFRAGFIAALLAGESLEATLRFANAAAAASCETRGAMDGIPARERVTEVLERS